MIHTGKLILPIWPVNAVTDLVEWRSVSFEIRHWRRRGRSVPCSGEGHATRYPVNNANRYLLVIMSNGLACLSHSFRGSNHKQARILGSEARGGSKSAIVIKKGYVTTLSGLSEVDTVSRLQCCGLLSHLMDWWWPALWRLRCWQRGNGDGGEINNRWTWLWRKWKQNSLKQYTSHQFITLHITLHSREGKIFSS